MSKRALLRFVTSVCVSVSLLFSGHIFAFADEVDTSTRPYHEYTFDNDLPYKVVDSPFFKEIALDGSENDSTCARITGYNGIGKARHFNGRIHMSFSPSVLPVGAQSIRFQFRKDASTVTDKSEPIISSHIGLDSQYKYKSVFHMGIGKYAANAKGALDNPIPGYLWISKIDDSGVNYEIQSPESICDGKWHDILFIWDGTTNSNAVKLYIDDMTTPVAQTTASSTDKRENSKGYLNVGYTQYYINHDYYKYTADYLTGDIDNLQFFYAAIKPNATDSGDPTTPDLLNLKAIAGNSKVDLSWNAVTDAASYIIKRSTTAGGPYTAIANDITGTSFTDTDVTNGTTYYYIITAIVAGRESNSNEASATPEAPQTPPTTEAKLKVVLEVSEALRLSVDDDLNVNTQMSWSSSEPTVATVNEKGIVTALAPGNTVITVKSADGSYTDYVNVLVVENADDYRLAIDLRVGETARLTADDFTNTANITWAPMDSSIANVTGKGKVTALSKGLVLISAKDADGNIIGRVYVRVRE